MEAGNGEVEILFGIGKRKGWEFIWRLDPRTPRADFSNFRLLSTHILFELLATSSQLHPRVGIVDLAAYPKVLYQLSLELKRRWIEPRIELGTVNSQRGPERFLSMNGRKDRIVIPS